MIWRRIKLLSRKPPFSFYVANAILVVFAVWQYAVSRVTSTGDLLWWILVIPSLALLLFGWRVVERGVKWSVWREMQDVTKEDK